LNYQNNCVETLKLVNKYQNFLQHCSLFLRFQQNYFDGQTKLFSDLFNKVLDLSAKLSFSCLLYFSLHPPQQLSIYLRNWLLSTIVIHCYILLLY